MVKGEKMKSKKTLLIVTLAIASLSSHQSFAASENIKINEYLNPETTELVKYINSLPENERLEALNNIPSNAKLAARVAEAVVVDIVAKEVEKGVEKSVEVSREVVREANEPAHREAREVVAHEREARDLSSYACGKVNNSLNHQSDETNFDN